MSIDLLSPIGRIVFWKRVGKKLKRVGGVDPEAISMRDAAPPLPKKLWIYWHQGWDTAPDLARAGLESWRSFNPGWEILPIDRTSAEQLSGVAAYADRMGIAHFTDILRLDLLRRHGGVWADASIICARPLDDWLPVMMGSGFFAFAKPFPDRMMSNWFLASTPGHSLVDIWLKAIEAYWAGHDKAIAYTVHHYLFELCYARDAAFRADWDATPQLRPDACHGLQAFLKGQASAGQRDALLAAGTAPMHKLSFKLEKNPAEMLQLLRSGAAS